MYLPTMYQYNMSHSNATGTDGDHYVGPHYGLQQSYKRLINNALPPGKVKSKEDWLGSNSYSDYHKDIIR